MLYILILIIIAVLMSIGLSTVIDNMCKRMLKPSDSNGCFFTVLIFDEGCNDMETSVAFFVKTNEKRAKHYTVILSDSLQDCDLDCAKLLSEKYSNVLICKGNELYRVMNTLDC